MPRQGEIWWAEAEDKRRPVLVVSRSQAVAVLNRVVCAPVTRTIRGIPTEILLGKANGLRESCAASFDNLQLVRRSLLAERVGSLANARRQICQALGALADC
jgi:mRNA interferase MazF